MSKSPPNKSYWLESGGGIRLPVRSVGILVGRSSECDLVVDDPQASRHHALVRLSAQGVELLPLGRNPIRRNGSTVGDACLVSIGDVLTLPGASLKLVMGDANLSSGPQWGLRVGDSTAVTLSSSPFVVGGCEGADLLLPGLPDELFVLHSSDETITLGCTDAELTFQGTGMVAGTTTPLKAGDTWTHGQTSYRLVRLDKPESQLTTALDATAMEPVGLRLQFLPVGGRLYVSLADREIAIYLSERRCAFIAVLLKPPGDLRPGDFVPDEDLMPRVWGRDEGDRNSLNVLISRTRKQLGGSGLDGFWLIERMQGGGATRFRVGAETPVHIS